LAVVELCVPPLRDHREDIPLLAAEFTRRYGERFGHEQVCLSPALVDALCRAEWPGNVRQLENAVARMVALGNGGVIEVEALGTAPAPLAMHTAAESATEGTIPLREQIEALERRVIARTLAAVSGNQSEAARRLGLNRGTLIERVRKYGLGDGAANSSV
jgi:two-component system response regulator AtoC